MFGGLCLFTFQSARTLTEHEIFAAEPAREMLAGHGWLLQPFAGELRTKKPPGQSWLIAASLAVTRSESEWAARLPSAIAGLGLAVVVAMIGARVGSGRIGLIAGLMTLTCVGVQQRARLAEADMALAFCVAAANAGLVPSPVYSRGRAREEGPEEMMNAECGMMNGRRSMSSDSSFIIHHSSFPVEAPSLTLPRLTGRGNQWRAFVFWCFVAAGFLIKGPIVLGFTVLPAVVTWAVLRFGLKNRLAATGVRRAAFRWPAVLLGVFVMVAWPTAAYLRYPAAAAQWKHEIVDRLLGKTGHPDAVRGQFAADEDSPDEATPAVKARRDSIFAYAWLTPQSTLPWIPFALVGLLWMTRPASQRSVSNEFPDPSNKPVLAYARRRPSFLSELGMYWWQALRRPANTFLFCWTACGLVVVSVIPQKVLHYVLPAIPPLMLLAAVGFDRLLATWLRRRPKGKRPGWAWAAIFAWFVPVTVGWAVWNGSVLPRTDTGGLALRVFAARVETIVPPGQTIYFYRLGEERTAYYLHRPLQQTQDLPPRPAYLIAASGDLPSLLKTTPATVLATADKFVPRDPETERRVLVRVESP